MAGMRITNGMMINNTLRDLNAGMARANKYRSQLASNRLMVNLSDDPIGLLNSMNARLQIRQIDQYRVNIRSAQKYLQQAETNVRDMEDVLKKIYEETINAAGVKNDEDKKNISLQIKELYKHLVETCNTAVGSKYIFAGHNTTNKPFVVDENGRVLYNGIDLVDQVRNGSAIPQPAAVPQVTLDPGASLNAGGHAGITGMTWSGPITAEGGPFTLDVDPVNTDTLVIMNNDTPPVEVGRKAVTGGAAGTGVTLDLTGFGLGTVTWDNDGTATAADVATAIAEAVSVERTPASGASNVEWVGGDLYPAKSYTITTDPPGSSKLVFTGTDGKVSNVDMSVDSMVKKTAVRDANGDVTHYDYVLDLRDYNLGMVKWQDDGTSTPEEMAAFIENVGTIESTLYDTMHSMVMGTDISAGAGMPTAAGVSAFSWTGEIAKQGKFDITSKGSVVTITDERGAQIAQFDTNRAPAGTYTEDLGDLGVISWTSTAVNANSAEALADYIASAQYVTTEYGYEYAQNKEFMVGYELKIDGTFTGMGIVGLGADNMFNVLDNLIYDLENGGDNAQISENITALSKVQSQLLSCIVELGARSTKLSTMENRYSQDYINAEAVRTDIEDIDQAYTIMQYKFAESIYQQALAAGAKVIQPTLMDFFN
ncbi:MAG TPA: flagellar hook-associated protein 3 [Clostridiales bacterium]|nr:flagellar hook-associated protein 3 [Clostridiales bacterium]